jgi:hypothetical protein
MRTSAFALTLSLLSSLTALASIPNVAAELPKLSRSSTWTPLSNFKLQFKTYHPQGMVKVGNVYYMSSVEILEDTQKYPQPQNGLDRYSTRQFLLKVLPVRERCAQSVPTSCQCALTLPA